MAFASGFGSSTTMFNNNSTSGGFGMATKQPYGGFPSNQSGAFGVRQLNVQSKELASHGVCPGTYGITRNMSHKNDYSVRPPSDNENRNLLVSVVHTEELHGLFSAKELRIVDYARGCLNAFDQPKCSLPINGLGTLSTGVPMLTPNQPGYDLLRVNNSNNNAFGNPSTGGFTASLSQNSAFSQNNSQFSFGGGSTSNSPFNSQSSTLGGGFFSNNTVAKTTFGSPGLSLNNGGVTLFGQQQSPSNNNVSIFGQNKAEVLFNKPIGSELFGAPTLGQSNENSLFGNNLNTGSNGLWNPNKSANLLTANKTSPSLFRTSVDTYSNTGGGSIFGNTTSQGTQGIFGPNPKGTAGLFGNTSGNTSALGGGSSLFGNNTLSTNNLTNSATGSLFSPTKAVGSSIFGGTAGVGQNSLFGNTYQSNVTGQSSLFGSPKPAGTTLFGTTPLGTTEHTTLPNTGATFEPHTSILNNTSLPNLSCCCPKSNEDDMAESIPDLYEKWFKDKNKPKKKTAECDMNGEWEQDLSYVLKQSLEMFAQNRRPVLISESEINPTTRPEGGPFRTTTIAVELPLPRPAYSEQVVHPYMMRAAYGNINNTIIKPSRPPKSPIKFTSNSYHLTE